MINLKVNYIKYEIPNLITINKIVTIHYYEFDKNFHYDGEKHNFWELLYVDSGQIEIEANGKPFTLKQGEIIFHKPNEFHTVKSDGINTANVFVISFVCSSETMNFFKHKITTVPDKLKKYIASIIDEYNHTFKSMSIYDSKLEVKENSPFGGQQIIRTLLEQFLILLIRYEKQNFGVHFVYSKENMENHLVSQIIEIIEANIYNRITVEYICNVLSYSRTYLSKIFKLSLNCTILEYILMLKIKEAKMLIRKGEHNFAQIAELLSFDNPHYFSRVFKRITNMSPSEYKKSAKIT